MHRSVVTPRIFVSAALVIILASGGCSSDATTSPPPHVPPALTNSIVFVSGRSGAAELYVMNGDDGSHVRELTTTPDLKYDPVFSPDGRQIAYAMGIIQPGGVSNIHVINSDGTNDTPLPGGGWIDFEPTWSPDGKRIAFVSTRDGDSEIYVMNVDGSNQTKLTNNTVYDILPSWSPTADAILFVSGRGVASAPNIYVMSSSGVPVDSVTEGTNPAWSPSGTGFLFVRSSQLFISATSDGSSVTDITPSGPLQRTPQWSPDGHRIVFSTDGMNGDEIWTESAQDASEARQLTNGVGNDLYPSWTRH